MNKGYFTMSETQSQIIFQKEFVEIMKAENKNHPKNENAVATAYEVLASEACLIPSRWEGLPWEYQLAFEHAVQTAYERGFSEGVKVASEIK